MLTEQENHDVKSLLRVATKIDNHSKRKGGKRYIACDTGNYRFHIGVFCFVVSYREDERFIPEYFVLRSLEALKAVFVRVMETGGDAGREFLTGRAMAISSPSVFWSLVFHRGRDVQQTVSQLLLEYGQKQQLNIKQTQKEHNETKDQAIEGDGQTGVFFQGALVSAKNWWNHWWTDRSQAREHIWQDVWQDRLSTKAALNASMRIAEFAEYLGFSRFMDMCLYEMAYFFTGLLERDIQYILEQGSTSEIRDGSVELAIYKATENLRSRDLLGYLLRPYETFQSFPPRFIIRFNVYATTTIIRSLADFHNAAVAVNSWLLERYGPQYSEKSPAKTDWVSMELERVRNLSPELCKELLRQHRIRELESKLDAYVQEQKSMQLELQAMEQKKNHTELGMQVLERCPENGIYLGPGHRVIKSISGPVSMYALLPQIHATYIQDQLQTAHPTFHPIILFGDMHESRQNACVDCTCSRNGGCCVELTNLPNFLRPLDDLARDIGDIDIYTETFPANMYRHRNPAFLHDIMNDQFEPCYYPHLNPHLRGACPTKHIRWHGGDIRNSAYNGMNRNLQTFSERLGGIDWSQFQGDRHSMYNMTNQVYIEGVLFYFQDMLQDYAYTGKPVPPQRDFYDITNHDFLAAHPIHQTAWNIWLGFLEIALSNNSPDILSRAVSWLVNRLQLPYVKHKSAVMKQIQKAKQALEGTHRSSDEFWVNVSHNLLMYQVSNSWLEYHKPNPLHKEAFFSAITKTKDQRTQVEHKYVKYAIDLMFWTCAGLVDIYTIARMCKYTKNTKLSLSFFGDAHVLNMYQCLCKYFGYRGYVIQKAPSYIEGVTRRCVDINMNLDIPLLMIKDYTTIERKE